MSYVLNLSVEIGAVVSIVLNFLIFFIKGQKFNKAKISDVVTFILFSFILFFSVYLYAIQKDFNFFKLLLNTFIFLFFLIDIKTLTKDSKTKILKNLIISLILFLSAFCLNFSNLLIIFLLLDLVLFLSYKYSSLNTQTIDLNFKIISLSASTVFYFSYFLNLFFDLEIFKLFFVFSFLLKTGIFPFVNYLTTTKNKNNISYSILIFNYIPLIFSIEFLKIYSSATPASLIQNTLFGFILLNSLTIAVFIPLERNIIRILSSISLFYFSFVLVNLILSKDVSFIKLMFLYSFIILFGFYLLNVLKTKGNINKLNLKTIKGLYYINRNISFCLTLILLINCIALPLTILYCRKIGFYTGYYFLILNTFILFSVFKIIQNLFTVNLKPLIKFKKSSD